MINSIKSHYSIILLEIFKRRKYLYPIPIANFDYTYIPIILYTFIIPIECTFFYYRGENKLIRFTFGKHNLCKLVIFTFYILYNPPFIFCMLYISNYLRNISHNTTVYIKWKFHFITLINSENLLTKLDFHHTKFTVYVLNQFDSTKIIRASLNLERA